MKKHKYLKRSLAGLTAAGMFFTLAVLDSKYNIETTEQHISFKNLPESFEGFRIVQLSDLHGMSFGNENRRLAEKVKEARPDLIVFTGDIAGKKGELKNVESLLEGIEGLAPAYYVNGNHEWANGCVSAIRELMEKHGIRCLSNEYELFYKKEESILVVGAEDPNGRADMIKPWGLSLKAGAEHPEQFKLWLAHRNDYVTEYPDIGTDLVLCGHAHGGIIRLPIVGGLLNLYHTLGAEYETGLYYSRHFVMSVSRGLGNSIPVPRLFNRPELVNIVLHRDQS